MRWVCCVTTEHFGSACDSMAMLKAACRSKVQDTDLRSSVMQEVISCAAKLGLSGLQLSPLDADTNAVDGSRQRGRSGGAGVGADADADIMAAQLREQLASRLRAAAPQQGPPEAWACLEVCALLLDPDPPRTQHTLARACFLVQLSDPPDTNNSANSSFSICRQSTNTSGWQQCSGASTRGGCCRRRRVAMSPPACGNWQACTTTSGCL